MSEPPTVTEVLGAMVGIGAAVFVGFGVRKAFTLYQKTHSIAESTRDTFSEASSTIGSSHKAL